MSQVNHLKPMEAISMVCRGKPFDAIHHRIQMENRDDRLAWLNTIAGAAVAMEASIKPFEESIKTEFTKLVGYVDRLSEITAMDGVEVAKS
jgi:hypothetical protein